MDKKKHIYANGCSFTEKDYTIYETGERPGWPMWPELLGKHLNLPVVNEAQGGAGNDYMERTSLRYIIENHEDIELVVIGWTQITRFQIFEKFLINTGFQLDVDPDTWKGEKYGNQIQHGIVGNMPRFTQTAMNFLLEDHWMQNVYSAFFRQVISIQKACEIFNIKYVFAQMISPISYSVLVHPKFDKKRHWDAWIYNPYLEQINKKNFMGWPGQRQLGGFSLDTSLTKIEHTVSKSDNHPNSHGQQILANKFIEHYEKIYRHT